MRRSQVSFLLTIAATLLFVLGLASGWLLATWTRAGNPMTNSWLIGLGLLATLLLTILFWLQRFVQLYLFRIKSFVEEAQRILQSNPEHRLKPTGPRDISALMELLNQYANRFQQLVNERDEQVQQARADLEAERNLLATLIADLSDGVVVCNRDGRILLYNRQARVLLSPTNTPTHTETSPEAGGYIGLGRSIFGLLDRNTLTYGLSHLESKHSRVTDNHVTGQPRYELIDQQLGTSFITTASGGGLLRTQMTPLLTAEGSLNGFVLTLHDMTEQLAASSRRDLLLQQLTERMRGGLGNVRAAIEMLIQFPAMPAEQVDRFQAIIEDEATLLSGELDQTMRNFADDMRAQWRIEEMAGSDLLWAVEQYLAEQEVIAANTVLARPTTEQSEELRLRVDSYAVVHGLATAIRSLCDEFQISTIDVLLHTLSAPSDVAAQTLTAPQPRPFATLDVRWSSADISTEAWLDWKERVSTVDESDATLTLRQVAERHGSEVWFQHDPTAEQSYFRLLLPLVDQGDAISSSRQSAAVAADMATRTDHADAIPTQSTDDHLDSRPEYYDFDLFGQIAQTEVNGDQSLDRLTYTVFDTETTGLDPQRDEIVSIGAVRVLNRRLLRQEIFDQLVDPQRSIPRLATEIHGIRDEMVQGEPLITQALPQFARFAEETILVGHNLAFDLRMFEMKIEQTGVAFTQPVLDTLLLSEVLQPDEQNHELEAIAERLGVNVLGRHTALGDSFVTAEVFLRMIPLLNVKGIFTLDEAISASKTTYLARVRY